MKKITEEELEYIQQEDLKQQQRFKELDDAVNNMTVYEEISYREN